MTLGAGPWGCEFTWVASQALSVPLTLPTHPGDTGRRQGLRGSAWLHRGTWTISCPETALQEHSRPGPRGKLRTRSFSGAMLSRAALQGLQD